MVWIVCGDGLYVRIWISLPSFLWTVIGALGGMSDTMTIAQCADTVKNESEVWKTKVFASHMLMLACIILSKDSHISDPFRNHAEVPGLSCLLWSLEKFPLSCGIWFNGPWLFPSSLTLLSLLSLLQLSFPPFLSPPTFFHSPLSFFHLCLCAHVCMGLLV